MVNPKEVRIGNWLLPEHDLDGKYHRVIDISEYSINGHLVHWYSAIPLTPEILEKCGFEKRHSELEPVAFCYFLDLPVNGENNNQIIFTVVRMGNQESWGVALVNDHWASNNFKHLHQLQNLYFALTGEELVYKHEMAISERNDHNGSNQES